MLIFVESVRAFVGHYTSLTISFIYKQLVNIWENHLTRDNVTQIFAHAHGGGYATFGEKDIALMKAVYEFGARSSFILFYYARGIQFAEFRNEWLDVYAEVKKGTETFANFSLTSFAATPDRSLFNLKSETYSELFLGAAVATVEAINIFGTQLFLTLKSILLTLLNPYANASAVAVSIQSTL